MNNKIFDKEMEAFYDKYRHLEILRPNHAGVFVRKGAKPTDVGINYGVIRIDNGILVYWTQEALIAMFHSNEKREEFMSIDEKKLMENGYVESIFIKDINRVLF